MKVLLLDADGVVLKRNRYFSERYAEARGVPPEKIAAFFKNEFVRCQVGKADLKESLRPHLADWKWEGSVDEFLDFWFRDDTLPDDAVLAEVAALRAQGVACYLASGQEKYRAAYITELLTGKLDGFFFSCDIGVLKSDPTFFRVVLTTLKVEPDVVAYLDNSESYVRAAQLVGISAHLYTGPADLARLAV